MVGFDLRLLGLLLKTIGGLVCGCWLTVWLFGYVVGFVGCVCFSGFAFGGGLVAGCLIVFGAFRAGLSVVCFGVSVPVGVYFVWCL